MHFGKAQPELMPGAKNAVETCLAVKPNEHVALIADEASRAVAASLVAAIDAVGAAYTTLMLEELGPRPMKTAPPPVLEALETADVGVMCMTPQTGELGAAHGYRKNCRAPPDSLRATWSASLRKSCSKGMRADYKMVDRLSDRLRERMLRAETLTVKTEAGTSFAAHFDHGLDWVKTSGLISPRYWSNLPAGEVFTTPATVDGTFVCDASAGDHFCGKYGDLQPTPMTLQIKGARLVGVECAREDWCRRASSPTPGRCFRQCWQ